MIDEWLHYLDAHVSAEYHRRVMRQLQNNIIPYLGDRPMDEIEHLELLEVVKKKETEGKLETAQRLLQYCGQIWKYAVTHGKAKHNIVADIDRKYALKKPISKNFPHITSEKELSTLLKDMDNYWGNTSVKYCLKLYPYLFVRPSELRLAEWSEFDFDKREWKVPTDRVGRKTGKLHVVPLPDQVVDILKELQALQGDFKHLFIGEPTSRAISDNSVRMALIRMGYKDVMTPHGFRHTASTLLNEHKKEHGFDGDVIEECLAHMDKNRIRGTYNHAKYYDERVELMQWWADFLEEVKTK